MGLIIAEPRPDTTGAREPALKNCVPTRPPLTHDPCKTQITGENSGPEDPENQRGVGGSHGYKNISGPETRLPHAGPFHEITGVN
jgi:hypothetical protein